jgi:hypothetical protein
MMWEETPRIISHCSRLLNLGTRCLISGELCSCYPVWTRFHGIEKRILKACLLPRWAGGRNRPPRAYGIIIIIINILMPGFIETSVGYLWEQATHQETCTQDWDRTAGDACR